MTSLPTTPPGRRTATTTTEPMMVLGVRHDRRAWLCFTVLAVILLAMTPLAGVASAQVPELPGLPGTGGGEDEDPDGEGDPEGEDPEGEGGGSEEPEGEEEGPGLPAAPGGEAETQTKTAYYTSPTSDALPRTLRAEFPPGVVCILFPDACAEGAQGLTGPIEAAALEAIAGGDAVTAGAQQPVPPGTLPVGILSGSQRYASALDIPLPPVGENQSFSELLVTLQMTDYAFALESPAFRELVNAVLIQATPNSGPEAFETLLSGIADGEIAAYTTDFPGLEMCVMKTPWEAGPSQPSSEQPEIDPLFCSPVAKPAPDGTVTFDMAFAVNDSLPGGFVPGWEGVLVRPLGSANLAFGDPDYSTNYIAYIDNPDEFPPAVTATVVDGPPPSQPITTGSAGGGGAGVSGGSGSSGGGSGNGSRSNGSGSSGGGGGSPATGTPGGPSTAGTGADVAGGTDDPVGGTAVDESGQGEAAAPLLDAEPVDIASSGWIPWVLLPMLLGGAIWYGRVLDGAPLERVSRAGAMTRLLQQRGFQI